MKRKGLSKTDRFEVFKRDGFVCQYCGSSPPKVVLEIDHIVAVSAGGPDDIDNLITACFDCNRGKGARELTATSEGITERLASLRERELQLKEYNKLCLLKI